MLFSGPDVRDTLYGNTGSATGSDLYVFDDLVERAFDIADDLELRVTQIRGLQFASIVHRRFDDFRTTEVTNSKSNAM